MKKIFLVASLIVFGITFNACSSDSDNNDEQYAYKVRMTDAPGPYDEVNIDLQAVEIIGTDGETITLNTTAGIYDLLTLSNGVSTQIATIGLGKVKASQIRLLLGPNNTIKVNGITYPLATPSADQSGLKINVTQTLTEDVDNDILIDFDANTSIVETGAGTYKLKPVLRTIVATTAGAIKGTITSVGSRAMVTATSASNVVYSSSVNGAGQFQISGLPAGTYQFTVTPELPALPVTQTNVVVTVGTTTNIGAISL